MDLAVAFLRPTDPCLKCLIEPMCSKEGSDRCDLFHKYTKYLTLLYYISLGAISYTIVYTCLRFLVDQKFYEEADVNIYMMTLAMGTPMYLLFIFMFVVTHFKIR